MHHTCNYYCQEGCHAKVVVVYGTRGATPETALASLRAAAAHLAPGITILTIRPAREWAGHAGGTLWCNTHHMLAADCGWCPQGDGTPWLMTFTGEWTQGKV